MKRHQQERAQQDGVHQRAGVVDDLPQVGGGNEGAVARNGRFRLIRRLVVISGSRGRIAHKGAAGTSGRIRSTARQHDQRQREKSKRLSM